MINHKYTRYAVLSLLFISLINISFFAFSTDAAVRVKGYYRKNGTYVQPHYRSNPDSNPYNNWSYPGNTNPYTGKVAPGNPDTYLKNYYNKSGGVPLPSVSLPSTSYSLPSYSTSNSSVGIGSTIIAGGKIMSGLLLCDKGYKSNYLNKSCDPISIPPNASLDYFGVGFTCNKGYKRNYLTDQCDQVYIPQNAHLNYWGDGFDCDYGFLKNYSSNICDPQNTYYNSSIYNYSVTNTSANSNSSGQAGTMRIKSSVKNYYDFNKTCIGLSDSDYSECISYAYNQDKAWVSY